MENSYNFIVVGAGPSGCVVASRLAHSASRPSVLLLEAGGQNDSVVHLSAAERMNVAFSPNSKLNWGYKTTPQHQLQGQEIDYSRGRGLGGSTAINFCGWVVGPKNDYDQWARLVGDESFNWRNAKRCLDRIENLHPEIPDPKLKKYVRAKKEDHSANGAVHLTYGGSWLPDVGDIFIAAEQSGLKTNQDVNSGDPLGMGMGSVCIYEGHRLTASIAYLSQPPSNLTICTDSAVAKVLFTGQKATGVKTTHGRIFYSEKEVIISGGAINTPQILMLSGVGPKEELEKHRILILHDLPQLGKNLQDHCFSSVGIVMEKDPNTIAGAQQSPTPMGWFDLPSVRSSQEYETLPKQTKEFMSSPTVPIIEIATHIAASMLSYTVPPDVSYLGAICLVMNPQSIGTVTLQSSNPEVAPLIDPKFLTHPYDRRVITEGLRQTMTLLSAPVYFARTIKKIGPVDDSDEAIWNHIRHNTFSSWHMSCTARMGTEIEFACVDSNFRVFGLEALRIVDLSVCPFAPNNHTQSTAYVVGEIAAEKLIREYNLQGGASRGGAARL